MSMRIQASIRAPVLRASVSGAAQRELHQPYQGEYRVVPQTAEQQFATKNTYMKDDLTVLAIPYYEVGNENGTTVIIGE